MFEFNSGLFISRLKLYSKFIPVGNKRYIKGLSIVDRKMRLNVSNSRNLRLLSRDKFRLLQPNILQYVANKFKIMPMAKQTRTLSVLTTPVLC